MIELCVAMGSFVPFIFVGALVIGFALWTNSRHQEAMKKVAADNGLRFHEGGVFGSNCKVEGEIGSARVVIDTYTSGSGKNKSTYTRVRVRDLNVDPGMSIGAEGVFSFIGKAFKGKDYEVGDSAFDNKVLVRADKPPEVCAVLDAPTRQAVFRAVDQGWGLDGGEWKVRKSGRISSAQRLQLLLDQGVAATEATKRDGQSILQKLQRIYTTDPQPRVRANALKERLNVKPPIADAELHALARDPSWLGLVAARALGTDEAVEHLHVAMKEGDPPGVKMSAAEMLADLDDPRVDRAAVEQVFTYAVEHEPWIDRGIRGLEKVGSVAAVPALLEHADGFLPSARKTAAKKAVRAIQARVAGAGRGQLAIAAAQGGELSEAEVRHRGALSQARQTER